MNKLFIINAYWAGLIWHTWTAHSEKEAEEIMSDNCTFGDFKTVSDSEDMRIYEAGRSA